MVGKRGMKLGLLAVATLCAAIVPSFAVQPGAAGGANTPADKRVWMTIGERRFSITLADTDAARSFAALLPLTLNMPDLNGNEKHVKLQKPLPTHASTPGTIRNGDLMLWGPDTLVVFYLTFDSPYSYTRLGRVDDPASLPQVLGRGEVRVVFTKN
jgi:hypothetical protein